MTTMAIESKLPRALEGRTSVGASLVLVGTLDPDAPTRALGMDPTARWHAGETLSYRRVPEKENGWALRIPFVDPFAPFKTVEDILTPLVASVEAHVDAWRVLRAAASFEAWLNAIVYVHDGAFPAMAFTPDFLRRVADLGLSMDVDMYALD
jgi:hypothetical protein